MYWTLGLGHRSTDVGCPGWSAPTVLWSRSGLQVLCLQYGLWADIYITSVNISYRYCLITLSIWVEQSNPGLSWFTNNTIISYESHLRITTQFRSGFYIHILERSFCLMLYNISMIQYHSRCVIRQLLWLRSTYPNVLLRLGFYMCSLQELCANWLIRHAPDRSASGAREHITWESPDNGLRHILLGHWGTRGILMYKVFPRNLYSTECHTSCRWYTVTCRHLLQFLTIIPSILTSKVSSMPC